MKNLFVDKEKNYNSNCESIYWETWQFREKLSLSVCPASEQCVPLPPPVGSL